MYPANFVNPTETLLHINKIEKPMDVLNIIKSYLFYDSETLKFAKKVASKNKKITQVIKNSKKTTCDGYWGLQLKPIYQQKARFQAYNCIICGEYTLTIWKNYKNTNNTLPICFCSD
jgi:hypothetical protein